MLKIGEIYKGKGQGKDKAEAEDKDKSKSISSSHTAILFEQLLKINAFATQITQRSQFEYDRGHGYSPITKTLFDLMSMICCCQYNGCGDVATAELDALGLAKVMGFDDCVLNVIRAQKNSSAGVTYTSDSGSQSIFRGICGPRSAENDGRTLSFTSYYHN